jgi:hypothetical protein
MIQPYYWNGVADTAECLQCPSISVVGCDATLNCPKDLGVGLQPIRGLYQLIPNYRKGKLLGRSDTRLHASKLRLDFSPSEADSSRKIRAQHTSPPVRTALTARHMELPESRPRIRTRSRLRPHPSAKRGEVKCHP